MMRRGVLFGGLLLVVWGVVAISTPIITVDQPEYDFGSIGIGYMVKHTFVLQNTGDQTLNIGRVSASCGCTTTALATDQLAPGESVPLEVKVLADHGALKNVAIRIFTNAPDEYGRANDDQTDADITLRVKGELTPKPDYALAAFELGYDLMLLVDVRDAASYAINHLIGAISIPTDELSDSMTSLPKGALIIVHDLAGEAADAAVQTLVDAGYMSAYYLQGGLSRWVEVQGDRYMVNSNPLPSESGGAASASSGRPWNQGTLRSDFYVLIDLRDADSYAAGHLGGAINVPSAQLPQWLDRLPREARVIVYDDDGSLGVAAYQVLSDAGYTRPLALLGGLNEWIYQYGEGFVLDL